MIIIDKKQFEPFQRQMANDINTIKEAMNNQALYQFGLPEKKVRALFIQLNNTNDFFENLLKDNESNKNTIESVQIEADKHRNELMQIINDSKIAANIAQQTLLSRD